MGSGKTAVGRVLAKKLGCKFIDSDAMIKAEAKMTIREIFAKWGEPRFRKMEAGIIKKLSSLNHCIIAAGGGVPINPVNMKNLKKSGVVFWLKANPATILARLKREPGGISARPLINKNDPLKNIKLFLARRKPYYKMADCAINTTGQTPEQIAKKIIVKICK